MPFFWLWFSNCASAYKAMVVGSSVVKNAAQPAREAAIVTGAQLSKLLETAIYRG
jgi:hypothetical protein